MDRESDINVWVNVHLGKIWRGKTTGGEIRKGSDTIIKFKGPLPTLPALYFRFPTCHPSVALTMNHSWFLQVPL